VVAMVAGNAMIVLAYLTIPVALLRLLKERRELVLNRIFLMFAAFIFACGTTHLIKIITIWKPLYWLEAIADTTTGVISLMTAILLIRLIPRIAKLPSADKLLEANLILEEENKRREQAEQELLITSEDLARSNAELEEFAWVAAHDLKEPVRTMGTYSTLLLSEHSQSLNDEGRYFLNYITDACGKAMARIDDVLSFSAL